MASKGSTKGADRGAVVAAAAVDRPEKIRNVAVVGHSGAGKTTLVEALLLATGTIPRAGTVPDGTTVSRLRTRPRSSSSARCRWPSPRSSTTGSRSTCSTPPATRTSSASCGPGLRAADAALFVVSAVDGVDATTVALWEECAAVGMPRAVVVTRLDHQRADFEESVAVCQRVFGDNVLPLYLPLHARRRHRRPA